MNGTAGAAGHAALANRLQKNDRHRARWARRSGIEAYRVYDRDIPEYPWAVDRYGDWLHVQLFDGKRELAAADISAQLDAIGSALNVAPERVAVKIRRRQRGLQQYEKLDDNAPSFVVAECGLQFEVNLGRYLDTGLFLDHRELRQRVRAEVAGKTFLNLFAYTGSFTVYAAAGGAAESVTVDLSRTYQAWTRRNLELNGFDNAAQHRLVAADVLTWLADAQSRPARFDLIVLDPPSFSNSSRMRDTLDVQRDHPSLIAGAVALLDPGGTVYFSNNRQGFRLDEAVSARYAVTDLGPATVPQDFSRRRPHRCWQIQRAS